MESINLTLKLQSEHRFRIPTGEYRFNDDLEVGDYYKIQITDRVTDTPDSGLMGLIAEKS